MCNMVLCLMRTWWGTGSRIAIDVLLDYAEVHNSQRRPCCWCTLETWYLVKKWVCAIPGKHWRCWLLKGREVSISIWAIQRGMWVRCWTRKIADLTDEGGTWQSGLFSWDSQVVMCVIAHHGMIVHHWVWEVVGSTVGYSHMWSKVAMRASSERAISNHVEVIWILRGGTNVVVWRCVGQLRLAQPRSMLQSHVAQSEEMHMASLTNVLGSLRIVWHWGMLYLHLARENVSAAVIALMRLMVKTPMLTSWAGC